jgi:hypothetical protein
LQLYQFPRGEFFQSGKSWQGRDFDRARQVNRGIDYELTWQCEFARLPNRIDPLSVPNDTIRRDERKMKMSCSRDDRSIGRISNNSKTEGLKQYFNCIRLDLKVGRMV